MVPMEASTLYFFRNERDPRMHYVPIVPMEASTLYFFHNERDPRMHRIALRKREKLNFVLMYVIMSEYESSVFR